jgi:hypothetical protein
MFYSNKLTGVVVLGLITVLFSVVGCESDSSNDASSTSSAIAPNEPTVAEINADRGDACECVNSTLVKIDVFTEEMNAGVYKTSQDLNAGLAIAMSGCMELKNHQEADKAWSLEMSGCEAFSQVRDAMMVVRDNALVLKEAEQDQFVKEVVKENGKGASGILDRLRDGTQSN